MTQFIRKHAPTKLDHFLFSDVSLKRRIQDYATGTRNGPIIFHGPFGTGKTTLAQLLVSEYIGYDNPHGNVGQVMYRGHEMTADQADNLPNVFSYYSFQWSMPRCWAIVDEADRLGIPQQQKLAAIIDSWGHLGSVILTTNNIHKMEQFLVHRCDCIPIDVISSDAALSLSQRILTREAVVVPDEYLRKVLSTSDGSIRDILRAVEDVCIEYSRKTIPARSAELNNCEAGSGTLAETPKLRTVSAPHPLPPSRSQRRSGR